MNLDHSARLSRVNCFRPERVNATGVRRIILHSLLVNIKMTSHTILIRQRSAAFCLGRLRVHSALEPGPVTLFVCYRVSDLWVATSRVL